MGSGGTSKAHERQLEGEGPKLTRRRLLIGGGALGLAGAGVVALGRALEQRNAPTRLCGEQHAVPEDPAHGRLLVERAIAAFDSSEEGLPDALCEPTPLSPRALAGLELPGCGSLPASLRAWLAFDATYGGWFTDLCKPRFPEFGLVDALVHVGAPRSMARAFAGLERETLPGHCLPFPVGDVTRRVLYLGATDERGEYPVLLLDWDDEPFVELYAPGIDVFLADLAGIVHAPRGGWAKDATYGARTRSAIAATFRGAAPPAYGDQGFSEIEEDSPTPAEFVRDMADPRTIPLPDGAIPPLNGDVRVMINPFTKKPERWTSFPAMTTCASACE